MNARAVVSVSVALSLLTAPALAYGDPAAEPQVPTPPTAFVHAGEPTSLCRQDDPSRCAPLPPGYFLDEARYAALDAELRRLQDSETRLTAENGSLRQSAQSWQPGWWTIATTAALGIALGVYLDRKL